MPRVTSRRDLGVVVGLGALLLRAGKRDIVHYQGRTGLFDARRSCVYPSGTAVSAKVIGRRRPARA